MKKNLLLLDIKKLRLLKPFILILVVQVIWLHNITQPGDNLWDVYIFFTNNVYSFFLLFIFGLLLFLESNHKSGSIQYLIDIRVGNKTEKLKCEFLFFGILSMIYTIIYFSLCFVILLITIGYDSGWSSFTITGENLNITYFGQLSPETATFLSFLSCLIAAIEISVLYTILSKAIGRFKFAVFSIFFILCACVDYTKVPILSWLDITNFSDYLFAGRLELVLIAFVQQKMYMVLMTILYISLALYISAFRKAERQYGNSLMNCMVYRLLYCRSLLKGIFSLLLIYAGLLYGTIFLEHQNKFSSVDWFVLLHGGYMVGETTFVETLIGIFPYLVVSYLIGRFLDFMLDKGELFTLIRLRNIRSYHAANIFFVILMSIIVISAFDLIQLLIIQTQSGGGSVNEMYQLYVRSSHFEFWRLFTNYLPYQFIGLTVASLLQFLIQKLSSNSTLGFITVAIVYFAIYMIPSLGSVSFLAFVQISKTGLLNVQTSPLLRYFLPNSIYILVLILILISIPLTGIYIRRRTTENGSN